MMGSEGFLSLERGDSGGRDSLLPQSSGAGRTIVGVVPPTPCTRCCFGTRACSFLNRLFKNCPQSVDFVTSEVVSSDLLLCWRVVTATYMFVVGFLFEWGAYPYDDFKEIWSAPPRDATDDDIPNMPPAYLTNWGFLTVLVYFVLASYWSVLDRRRLRSSALASHPSKVSSSVVSSHLPVSALHCFTWYLFVLAATLQPFVVVGYWGLVYPSSLECDFRCATVHVLACVAIWIELLVSNLTVDADLLPLVILYPLLWTLSQIIWIYSGHKPDYEVLPMDDWFSIGVSAGAMVFVGSTFFLVRYVARRRDRRSGRDRLSDRGVYHRPGASEFLSTTAAHTAESANAIHF